MTLKTGLFAACLVTLALLGTPEMVRALLGTAGEHELRRQTAVFITAVSLSFALIAAAVDLFRERETGSNMRQRLRRMPVEIVPFFLSFCLILRGVEDAGLVKRAGQYVLLAFEQGAVVGSLMSGVYGILVVNTMNNIPATIFFEKAWLGSQQAIPPMLGLEQRLADLDPSYPDIFVDTCLYASNFGANLTFIGALAGLMWLGIIRKEAERWSIAHVPTARSFLACGVVVVPLVTFATCVVIALGH
jgi:Na+/H+ antiporter NhaD/arsenite permease-like protein